MDRHQCLKKAHPNYIGTVPNKSHAAQTSKDTFLALARQPSRAKKQHYVAKVSG